MITRDIVKGESGSLIYKKYPKMKRDKLLKKDNFLLETIQTNSPKIKRPDLQLKPRREKSNAEELKKIKLLNSDYNQQ